MESVYVGAWSLLPPVVAIVLALITKEVVFSLVAGVLSGTIIYASAAGLNPVVAPVNVMFELILGRADWYIMLFCFLLGSLVYLINASGGAKAYGRWASRVIRSKTQSTLLTTLLGCLIFIDDYFNALTVGSVMKPVSDRYRVSRPKLAYLIDSTSAPICILVPISTWGAAVGGYMVDTGVFSSGISGFMAMVPYNLYALLCLLMVILICIFSWDFGPMYRFELKARRGDLSAAADQDYESMETPSNATLWDMVLPILVLVVVSILAMMYIGGFWSDDPAVAGLFGPSLGNSVSGQALTWGSFAAILFSLLLYVPRKIMSFHEFFQGVVKGMEPMITAGVILLLAWAIGGVCRELLSTPEYVSNLFQTLGVPGAILPMMVFIFAAFLSFSTGTSWGTFGILLPIVAPVAQAIAPNLTVAALAATLAGSIFGDHCSPISDTTILSSTGASCNHLDHVGSQMPYALTIAACSLVGYILIGITGNGIIGLVVSAVLLVAAMIVLHRAAVKKYGTGDEAEAAA